MSINYLNKKLLLVINAMAVSLSGGSSDGRSNLRPGQNLGFVENIFYNNLFGQKIYNDIFEQAAAYMFFIIKNHTFVDGNKRTGLAAAVLLLEWNGYALAPFDENKVFDTVIMIASGKNDPDHVIPYIAQWLRSISLE
jgi:death-on-curing family protein